MSNSVLAHFRPVATQRELEDIEAAIALSLAEERARHDAAEAAAAAGARVVPSGSPRPAYRVCVVCRLGVQGFACSVCAAPVHGRCLPSHAHAHAREAAAANPAPTAPPASAEPSSTTPSPVPPQPASSSSSSSPTSASATVEVRFTLGVSAFRTGSSSSSDGGAAAAPARSSHGRYAWAELQNAVERAVADRLGAGGVDADVCVLGWYDEEGDFVTLGGTVPETMELVMSGGAGAAAAAAVVTVVARVAGCEWSGPVEFRVELEVEREDEEAEQVDEARGEEVREGPKEIEVVAEAAEAGPAVEEAEKADTEVVEEQQKVEEVVEVPSVEERSVTPPPSPPAAAQQKVADGEVSAEVDADIVAEARVPSDQTTTTLAERMEQLSSFGSSAPTSPRCATADSVRAAAAQQQQVPASVRSNASSISSVAPSFASVMAGAGPRVTGGGGGFFAPQVPALVLSPQLSQVSGATPQPTPLPSYRVALADLGGSQQRSGFGTNPDPELHPKEVCVAPDTPRADSPPLTAPPLSLSLPLSLPQAEDAVAKEDEAEAAVLEGEQAEQEEEEQEEEEEACATGDEDSPIVLVSPTAAAAAASSSSSSSHQDVVAAVAAAAAAAAASQAAADSRLSVEGLPTQRSGGSLGLTDWGSSDSFQFCEHDDFVSLIDPATGGVEEQA